MKSVDRTSGGYQVVVDLVGMQGEVDCFGWQEGKCNRRGEKINPHFPATPCWQVLNDCFFPLPITAEEQFFSLSGNIWSFGCWEGKRSSFCGFRWYFFLLFFKFSCPQVRLGYYSISFQTSLLDVVKVTIKCSVVLCWLGSICGTTSVTSETDYSPLLQYSQERVNFS